MRERYGIKVRPQLSAAVSVPGPKLLQLALCVHLLVFINYFGHSS